MSNEVSQGNSPENPVEAEVLAYGKKPVGEEQEVCEVEDGNAFIEDIVREIKLTKKEVNIEVAGKVRKFYIRQLGVGDINEVFQGDWRSNPLEGDDLKNFNSLEKAEKMFVLSVQKCVVKKDGKTSLWEPANVFHMVRGKDAALYTDILSTLYHEACQVNPILLPHLNPMALKMLFQWW